MARYVAMIDEADGMFGVVFPDAPGCTAMGKTEDEAIDAATDALAEWAADERTEGRKVPPPRSYIQLLKSRQYPKLGKGGMIAYVPLINETGRQARANISLDEGLLHDIDEAANRLKITRSAFLAAAAKEKIRAAG